MALHPIPPITPRRYLYTPMPPPSSIPLSPYSPANSPGIDTPGTRRLALRVLTQPKDTNHYGTIFGGVILSYIDQAAFIESMRHGRHRWVTASVDRVDFKAPVHTGDIVNFYTLTTRTGTKSVSVGVEVEVERFATAERVAVTSAVLTMVSVDALGKPIPFLSPATI